MSRGLEERAVIDSLPMPKRKKPKLTPELREALRALGSIGGKKGGKARWKGVPAEERRRVAKKAAEARWKKGTRMTMRSPGAILNDITHLLRTHADIGAHLGQEPYKGNLFKLCEEAHAARYHHITSSPRLSADGLRDAVREQLSWHEDQNRLKVLDRLCEMWHEWLYALDRCRSSEA